MFNFVNRCAVVAVTLAVVPVAIISVAHGQAQQLTADNWDAFVPAGKEVDAIYGDFALRNSAAKAIVAFPDVSRNSNMTVRSVAGCLIDLAATSFESDQLSAFYPGRRRFPFSAATTEKQSVIVKSTGTSARPACTVRYEFMTQKPVIDVTSEWTNTTSTNWTLKLEDDLRADAGNEDMVKSANGTRHVFCIDDVFWQQAYAIVAPGYNIRCNSNSRESVLEYEPPDGKPVVIKPSEKFSFTRQIVVGRDLVQVLAVVDQTVNHRPVRTCQLKLTTADGQPVGNAQIEFREGDERRGTVRSGSDGAVTVNLPEGIFTVNASIGGVPLLPRDGTVVEIGADGNTFDLQSGTYRPGLVHAAITDGDGAAIPAKVEFTGNADTPTPDWGPDSAEHFVRNLAYTENGRFEVPMQAGEYDVIISHGPEYDAVFTKLHVDAGKTVELKASLKHSVQTPGWVSSDFHSHSSPSGDNTGSQRGRVLNLAAENIEFAPCTEHNRVSTYDVHIAELGLQAFLATVSGMELTGQPLPLNHQNVFPMKYTPRTQDGGGPVTDASPETQMERIALWDDRSEKLIQQNHPDLGWLFFDRNGDGTPDGGFSRSFGLMDVMEIHPIDRVLDITRFDIRNEKPVGNNRILNWLQLLNRGHRIYGVVNTDAHYNYHGSGWLRNWIQSGTDDPAKIDSMEMVHAAEQGRLIMSNGPYLEATFRAADTRETIVCGQDLTAKSGSVTAHIRVQCPNWIDIDTVFVLVNGKLVPEYQFTRDANPGSFSDGVVKFDSTVTITLSEDSHLVVVTGHRTEVLGDVMGPTWGKQHPAAMTNPAFIDIDGNGFAPNRDTLGFPLPVKFGQEK